MPAVILVYHRVAVADTDPWALSVAPARFAEHLDVIRRDWRPIALAELARATVKGEIPERSVAITFDDGYRDNAVAAYPMLVARGIPATFFVVAGAIERSGLAAGFWWDELEALVLGRHRLPERLTLELDGSIRSWELGHEAAFSPDPRWRAWEPAPCPRHAAYYAIWQTLQARPAAEQTAALAALAAQLPEPPARRSPAILRPDELRTLSEGGLVEIGAHTMTHPSLAALPLSVQRWEIDQSRDRLARAIGRPITSFAYPFGGVSAFTADTVELVRQAGFVAACTTEAAPVQCGIDPLRLPRFHPEDIDGETFGRLLEQWYHQPEAAAK